MLAPRTFPVIEQKRCAPKTWPCPVCGIRGRRERTRTREVHHLAQGHEAWWEVTVGVYRAKCGCCRQIMRKTGERVMPVRKRVRYFTSRVEGVDPGADHTDAVRRKVVDLVVRDRLTNDQVIAHLQEDFHLSISVGFIYNCLDRAQKRAA